ncbi:MAG: Kelch repeat-containing protein, partial [Flammeovirgaceae bacterium]
FWEFDPAGNSGQGSWKKIKDFGGTSETGRYGSYSFTLSNRGFVGGGFNGNAANDLWEYLPSSNTWVQRTSNSSKRVNAVTFVINNLAYVIGGANNGLTVKTVEQYDPVADSWSQKAQLTQKDANGNKIAQPLSREFAVGFSIGSNGYITGGSINSTPIGDTWQYDPSTDTWVEYYLFSTEARTRDAACGFGIGNFGYVATGRSGNLRFDDTWVFDPTGTEDNGK